MTMEYTDQGENLLLPIGGFVERMDFDVEKKQLHLLVNVGPGVEYERHVIPLDKVYRSVHLKQGS